MNDVATPERALLFVPAIEWVVIVQAISHKKEEKKEQKVDVPINLHSDSTAATPGTIGSDDQFQTGSATNPQQGDNWEVPERWIHRQSAGGAWCQPHRLWHLPV